MQQIKWYFSKHQLNLHCELKSHPFAFFWAPGFSWKGLIINSCLSVRPCVRLKPVLLVISPLIFLFLKNGKMILRNAKKLAKTEFRGKLRFAPKWENEPKNGIFCILLKVLSLFFPGNNLK